MRFSWGNGREDLPDRRTSITHASLSTLLFPALQTESFPPMTLLLVLPGLFTTLRRGRSWWVRLLCCCVSGLGQHGGTPQSLFRICALLSPDPSSDGPEGPCGRRWRAGFASFIKKGPAGGPMNYHISNTKPRATTASQVPGNTVTGEIPAKPIPRPASRLGPTTTKVLYIAPDSAPCPTTSQAIHFPSSPRCLCPERPAPFYSRPCTGPSRRDQV